MCSEYTLKVEEHSEIYDQNDIHYMWYRYCTWYHMIVNCWNMKNCSIWYSWNFIQYQTWWEFINTHIDWYISLLLHNIHIKYVIKNLRLLLVYMIYRYKTMWHETTCKIKLVSLKNTDICNNNMMLCFIWHSDELNHN